MSGRLIELTAGKVPQRAIRHLGSLPYATSLRFDAVDFGTPTANLSWNQSTSMRGKVLALDLYNVTETFNVTTLNAGIEIGIDGGDTDAYCTTNRGILALAAATAQNFNVNDGTLINGVDEIIPVSGIQTLTPIANTGGTPAGICDVTVTILNFE